MWVKRFMRSLARGLLIRFIPDKLSILHLASCYRRKKYLSERDLDSK